MLAKYLLKVFLSLTLNHSLNSKDEVMAGNKNLFQWFCAVSNQEDSLLSLVRGQHPSKKKKFQPQSRKILLYEWPLWLILFLVYFLLGMIQVGNMGWLVNYQIFSSLDVDKNGHHNEN